jgi:hypothetical protein
VLASAPNLGHGFLGGEGQDVGAGNLVPAPRVAVHGGLGVHDRLEPLRLQRLVVGVPPVRDVIPTPDLRIGTGSPHRINGIRARLGRCSVAGEEERKEKKKEKENRKEKGG